MDGSRPGFVAPSDPIPCIATAVRFFASIRFSAPAETRAEGFRHLGFKDDHAQNAAEWIVYDALYAYCREMVKRGKPHGDFMS